MRDAAPFHIPGVWKLVLGALVFLLLTVPAQAAVTGYGPGFWSGFGDGFLALLRLLLSPIVPVTIVDLDATSWTYDAGYYLGVITFTGTAGAAALPSQTEPVVVRRTEQLPSTKHQSS